MASTLVLHIGSNKTASTTIQRKLSLSGKALSISGLLYPKIGQSRVGAHHLIAAHLVHNPPEIFKQSTSYSETLAELGREIKGFGAFSQDSTVIVSSEMLFPFVKIDHEKLRQLMALFTKVKVLVYLRRQDQFLESFYNSRIRNGEQSPEFPSFCKMAAPAYLSNLEDWKRFLGSEDLIVRPFNARFWPNGNICDDFFERIGSEMSDKRLTTIENLNISLPLEVMDVLRPISGRVKIKNYQGFIEQLTRSLTYIREPSRATLINEELYLQIKERFEEENKEIEHKYFTPEEQGALRFEDRYLSSNETYTPLNIEERSQLLAATWNALADSKKNA